MATLNKIRGDGREMIADVMGGRDSEENKEFKCPESELNGRAAKMAKLTKKVIRGDAREIVSKVIEACDAEATNKEFKFPLSQPNARASFYTGVSGRSISRIRKENKVRNLTNPSTPLPTPGAKRQRLGVCDKISDLDFEVIRRIIEDFYLVKKQAPNCRNLLNEIKTKIDFNYYSKSTLRVLLKAKGFVWWKCQYKRRVVMERPQILQWRCKYLRAIETYKQQNKNIYYVDETLVDQRCCQSKDSNGASASIRFPGRLTVVHAGSEKGWVPNVSAMSTGQLNNENFTKWLTERLLPNIAPNSVIVFDNAPYHSEIDNKCPKKYATQAEIKSWLDNHNIKYDPLCRKSDLMDILDEHRPREHIYKIDTVIRESGHLPLRLPPYMSALNPIELAWVDMKQYIRDNNTSTNLNIENLKKITSEAINSITQEKWKHYVDQTTIKEEHYWRTDGQMEEVLDKFILNGGDDDSASDSESSSEDDAEMCDAPSLVVVKTEIPSDDISIQLEQPLNLIKDCRMTNGKPAI